MPATKTQRRTPAKAPARKSGAVASRPRTAKPRTAVAKTTGLSDEVLTSVESGQRAAIEAVRKFVDTVDQRLPRQGEGASGRQEVIDAAMEMADRLVHTQYDFIRKVVDSAGDTLTKSDNRK